MGTVNATNARKNLYRLIDDVNESHEPVTITGKSTSAVLVSEQDWNAIQETLYLAAVPGMRESIRKGMREPIEECSESPGW
ncbi:MAG: type II toxin-antitoxin system Phd/YefM family antitoxin [Spirochaetaceae bacterium]|nr:MAG: type II toxin-antitoxin system Phd/YefM family antitoxin [Spirochaetaceae bacterium]